MKTTLSLENKITTWIISYYHYWMLYARWLPICCWDSLSQECCMYSCRRSSMPSICRGITSCQLFGLHSWVFPYPFVRAASSLQLSAWKTRRLRKELVCATILTLLIIFALMMKLFSKCVNTSFSKYKYSVRKYTKKSKKRGEKCVNYY